MNIYAAIAEHLKTTLPHNYLLTHEDRNTHHTIKITSIQPTTELIILCVGTTIQLTNPDILTGYKRTSYDLNDPNSLETLHNDIQNHILKLKRLYND